MRAPSGRGRPAAWADADYRAGWTFVLFAGTKDTYTGCVMKFHHKFCRVGGDRGELLRSRRRGESSRIRSCAVRAAGHHPSGRYFLIQIGKPRNRAVAGLSYAPYGGIFVGVAKSAFFGLAFSIPCGYNHLCDLKQGALAQLGERYTGSVEVGGSSPLCSTIHDIETAAMPFFCFEGNSSALTLLEIPPLLPPR